MEKRITTLDNGVGKKGDYWYIDRKSRIGTRLLTLALVIGIAVLGASCGASNMGLDDQMGQTDATRGTSGLLDGVLNTVTTTLTTTTTTLLGGTTSSTKWYFDCDVVQIPDANCPLKWYLDNRVLTIGSTKAFDKFEVYYTDRTKDRLDVNASSLTYKLRYGKTLDGFFVRLKSDGSKWYCDNSKWFVDVDDARWYGDVDSCSTSTTSSGVVY
jgi:hypothetical protein